MKRGYKTDPQTSLRMRRIRTSGTKPEQLLSRLLRSLGFRFAQNGRNLPGRPDFVFTRRRKVIFVHGCFWHRHEKCSRSTMPAKNVALWKDKFARTLVRDKTAISALKKLGWKTLVIWECQIQSQNEHQVIQKLARFLSQNRLKSKN